MINPKPFHVVLPPLFSWNHHFTTMEEYEQVCNLREYNQEEDSELKREGKLWKYLIDLAEYSGGVEEYYQRSGPYKYDV